MFLKIKLDNSSLYIEVAAIRKLIIAFLHFKAVLEDFAGIALFIQREMIRACSSINVLICN